ncbi:MAG: MoxR-like ATPase [Blastocatellia bacterium]|nr:MoxR-like ATPase [Blastocatellia bacterium]
MSLQDAQPTSLESAVALAAENALQRVALARAAVGAVIFGQEQVVEQTLVTLLSGGHGLLVGVPGLAKTKLVETLGIVLGLSGQRVQFTPDLMPADILGSEVLEEAADKRRTFRFIRGPIFAQLLMADEINRASPRTQSALLQAMQEQHVTVAGTRHDLPRPFHVLATQNPLEQEGTYPLPEAQIDRFMMKVLVSYPNRAEERAILDAMATSEPLASVRPVVSAQQILNARHVVNSLYVDDKIRNYIVDLVLATRPPFAKSLNIEGFIQTGASPRATINLTLAARAIAFLNGRHYVTPQDVKSIAMDVLRHRVSVTYEAEAENITSEDVIQKILDALPVP